METNKPEKPLLVHEATDETTGYVIGTLFSDEEWYEACEIARDMRRQIEIHVVLGKEIV